MPLLTIGMPVYNGENTIKETLESIFSQIDDNIASEVEILFSDNASTDNTASIIAEYKEKYPNIVSYYKNETNIGYDRNVDAVFKKAQGDFVWLFACDDIQRENAISEVLSTIRANQNIPVFLVNFDMYNYDLTEFQHASYINNNIDICFDSYTEFLYKVDSKYSLVSCLIFNKKEWNSINLTKGFGCQFIHVFALFTILVKQSSAFAIDKYLLTARLGKSSSEKKVDDKILVPLNYIRILKYFKKTTNFDRDCLKFLLNYNRTYLYQMTRVALALGLDDKLYVFKELVRYNYESWTFWKKCARLFFKRKSRL